MRSKFRLRHIIVAAVNAAAVVGAVVLTAAGSSAARSQGYNYAAQRWQSGSESSFSQISCYFSRDAGFDKNSVKGMQSTILGKLKDVSIIPEEGKTLVPCGYSIPAGKAKVTCDIRGKADADITAVGGDFFLFRDFRLLSGSFFSDDDLMHNGAVIDRQLAWLLYGAEDIIGMNIYINNVKFYVSGVIDAPDTKVERDCIDKAPRAYISYDMAGSVFGAGYDAGMSGDFDKVTCYECVVPDPVENFAYNTIKDSLAESYKGSIDIVNNTERFEPKKRIKALKKTDRYIIRSNEIVYPYWENASRVIEVRLSLIYGARRLLLVIPVITLAVLIIKVFLLYKRKEEGLKKALLDRASVMWHRFRSSFGRKAHGQKKKKAEAEMPMHTKESQI